MTRAIADIDPRDRALALSAETAGVLHLVVGPSGAGKDTLIDAAREARPDMLFAQRAITRPVDAGGEAHRAMTPEAFDAAEADGVFALSWRAHGLAYGLPLEIDDALIEGRNVIANGSRQALAAARARYPKLRILHVSAAPEILAQRLAQRGRESEAAVAERLRRALEWRLEGADVIEIDNGGPLERGVAAFLAALAPAAPTPPSRDDAASAP